ncbi:MAG: hypothetical protein NTW86_23490 [Candidatus Sumerlaeota bacterium]|nr:hypothetical protein [Candidatus Sumerlaeota bacterium]
MRSDGLAWAILFNNDQTFEGKAPAGIVGLRKAIDTIAEWR